MIQPTDIQQAIPNINFAGKKPDELMGAARQFESVFLNQLFNAMESTVEKDEMFSGGKGEEMFKSMFFDEIAKDTASNPATSFGFAKQIYEQMKNKV